MYEVKIVGSSKELTAKEKIVALDMSLATKLDEAVAGGNVSWEPDYMVTISVHNDKARGADVDPSRMDYEKYVFVAKDGARYITGSKAFAESYKRIVEQMAGSDESFWVVCYRKDSKNYPGKQYLACGIA